MTKPKVAFYWNASCGGCEEAIVDLGEGLFKVLDAIEIVFWPVALDYKYEDLEKMADGEITVSFINGGIRFTEHEEIVKLLRRKSKIVVAYGSCAHLGGIPGLANLWTKESLLKYVFLEAPTVVNEEKILPKEKVKNEVGEIKLTTVSNELRPLNQVIDVDYYVPGCPPQPKVTLKAVETLLSGELPPKGSVIGASNTALCEECPLNETKPDKVFLKEIKRPHEIIPEPDKCLLVQGLLCLGPATRGGCEARCIKVNMPCTGCSGPLDNVLDYGARVISFIASIIEADEEDKVKRVLEKLVDPIGLIYKYSLPSSILKDLIKRRE